MHIPRFRSLLPVLLLCGMLIACSDGSTDAERVVANIEGRWTLTVDLTSEDGSMTCEITNLSILVNQQGTTQLFGGTSTGGTLTCSRDGESESRTLESFVISGGRQAEGTEIEFDLVEDPTFLAFEGRFSNVAMTGEVFGLLGVGLLGEDDAALGMVGTFDADRAST